MNTYVISSSGLNAFKRCPKSFELGYERGLSPSSVKSYITDGSDFHAYAAEYARFRRGDADTLISDPENDLMFDVHAEWVANRGGDEYDAMNKIMLVEEPVFTLIGMYGGTQVFLRTTFDLVYEDKDGWIVCRDYKTFEKMPSSLDADLDFQARSYIAALMQKYGTRNVRFEHVYIRRWPPSRKKEAKSGGYWTPDECYVYESIVIPPQEAKMLWGEVRSITAAIMRAKKGSLIQDPAPWYRVDLKGTSPHCCHGCFYKEACKSEVSNGVLTDDTIQALGFNIREQMTLPEIEKEKAV